MISTGIFSPAMRPPSPRLPDEELPAASRAVVIVEIANRSEEQPIQTPARADIRWLHRDAAAPASNDLLSSALAAMTLPPGVGYAWVAAEASGAKNLRRHLVEERGLPKDRVKAAALTGSVAPSPYTRPTMISY